MARICRELGCGRDDLGRIELQKRLPIADAVSGRDVLDLVDEGIRPRSHDRDTPLVELDRAGYAHRIGHDTGLHSFEAHARALQLAARDRNCCAVRFIPFIDRDVIHPHRILFWRLGDIGQAHRIAVVENPFAARRGGSSVLPLRIEGQILIGTHRAVRPAVRGILRLRRIERPSVGVLVVDDRPARHACTGLHAAVVRPWQ